MSRWPIGALAAELALGLALELGVHDGQQRIQVVVLPATDLGEHARYVALILHGAHVAEGVRPEPRP